MPTRQPVLDHLITVPPPLFHSLPHQLVNLHPHPLLHPLSHVTARRGHTRMYQTLHNASHALRCSTLTLGLTSANTVPPLWYLMLINLNVSGKHANPPMRWLPHPTELLRNNQSDWDLQTPLPYSTPLSCSTPMPYIREGMSIENNLDGKVLSAVSTAFIDLFWRFLEMNTCYHCPPHLVLSINIDYTKVMEKVKRRRHGSRLKTKK
jgi:hypothetical protein